MLKNYFLKFLLFVIYIGYCQSLYIEDKKLQNFTSVLENYSTTQNDVIFVLDESGSIGIDTFPGVTNFTEMVARHLSISERDSRVAIITYDDNVRLILNYIKNPHGNNMCSFLPQLLTIIYHAGYTATGSALEKAHEIFRSDARPNSNKIIVLMTDGKSNRGREVTGVIKELKNDKIIIFAVGIADINEEEINLVATSKDHIYILKNLSYIFYLNDRLKKDTVETEWDYLNDTSLCNKFCRAGHDCCDKNAECRCGTKGGNHECVCKAGYEGTGNAGYCFACPRGKYKSKVGVSLCETCPGNSTTSREASISVTECKCLPGYEGLPQEKRDCTAIRCIKLSPPLGGITLPSICSNTFGSVCNFKCNEGYCPYSCSNVNLQSNYISPWNILPDEPRQCLENGHWTGKDFYCEKMKCPSLISPNYGTHNCSKSDFTFGTVCHISCNSGFTLIGSSIRKCLSNGSWSGKTTSCKANYCPPLKTNQRLRIRPEECSTGLMGYQSICQYYCSKGYKLMLNSKTNFTVGERRCLASGKWLNSKEDLYCKDEELPTIKCPLSQKRSADPGKASALVSWELPKAKDNEGINFYEIIYPRRIKKPPVMLPLGVTKIVYEVRDFSNLKNNCSFSISIIDREPPRILYCPSNIEKMHEHKAGVSVHWNLPKFQDNSGNASITFVSRKNGDIFPWGPPSNVTYKISDASGNVVECSFSVKVKGYSCPYMDPPTNGYMTCDKWSDGQFCSVFCQKGFKFITKPESVYYCSQRSKQWSKYRGRGKVTTPWPDCASTVNPQGVTGTVLTNYSVSTCDDEDIKRVKIEFLKLAERRGFCPSDLSCNIGNINVTCKLPTGSSRVKRNALNIAKQWNMKETLWSKDFHKSLDRKRRETTQATLILSYDIQVTKVNSSDVNDTGFCLNCSITSDELLISGADIIDNLQSNIEKVVEKEYKNHDPVKTTHKVQKLSLSCKKGSMLVNNTCVACPLGTYFNNTRAACFVCPKDHYQDVEGSFFCKRCPENTTSSTKSKSLSDCRGLCKPGFYSETGYEQCTSCSEGYYMSDIGSTYCVPCPHGSSTSMAGADSVSKCALPCAPGTNSSDGLEPCMPCPLGTYQPNYKSKLCIKCSHGTTTLYEKSTNKLYCQSFNFCEDYKPCANGSTCIELNNNYKCECQKGFSGKQCYTNINDCDADACLNGGTCIDGIDSFTCNCLDGFFGPRCENNIDDCKPDLCKNGGTCEDLLSSYTCHCIEGFSGQNCEINIDECASNPCQNNGTCFDSINDFRCCCPKGYTGHICDNIADYCSEIACLNNGTCYSDENGFTCSCDDGFKGKFCEIDIDDCVSNPCQNGGSCINKIGNTTCHCPDVYFGQYCENELTLEFEVKFPSPPETSNFISLHNPLRLFEITISFYMRTDYVNKNNRGTPISYTVKHPTEGFKDGIFTLLDVNKLILYLHGKQFDTNFVANKAYEWHHYVVTWENANGTWAFYVDGNLIVSSYGLETGNYIYPGIFVLGQDQDVYGGGFSISESFAGEITEFNVWDYSFTADEIKAIHGKCGFHGNVIKWPIAQRHLNGDLTIEKNVDLCIGSTCLPNTCHCSYNGSQERDYFCKHRVENCTSSSCVNGQCIEADENFCLCDDGFEGRLCTYDIDECSKDNGKCDYKCINTLGSYKCFCPPEKVLSEDGHTCREKSICKVGKVVYNDGDKWQHECEECICDAGYVNCSLKLCPTTNCNSSNEKLVKLPGQCCPSCISGAACMIKDNELTTFDGQIFHFNGHCQYKLVSDIYTRHFDIEFKALKNSNNSCKQLLTMRILCSKLHISENNLLYLNSEEISLPYEDDTFFIDYDYASRIIIETNLGIRVEWSCDGIINVTIPSSYQQKLNGLCGNYNNDFRDDLNISSSRPSNIITEFIKKWKVNSSNCTYEKNGNQIIENLKDLPSKSLNHEVLLEKNPWINLNCNIKGEKKRKYMMLLCQMLWKEPFSECHKYVDPTLYYVSCLQEVCRCKPRGTCYCNPILSYAIECTNIGRNIDSYPLINVIKRCRKKCPPRMQYYECGPSCPATCFSKENENEVCSKERCVSGCYCSEDFVLNKKNECISKDKCTVI